MQPTSMTVVGLAIAFHVFAMAGGMILEKQGMVWDGTADAAGAEAGQAR